jgi:hydroxymethylglutaryl-CoA lyase
MAALEMGLDRFETAAGGLGGCPFAPGASGNMATEDLVFMMREIGIKTNVDLPALIACSEFMSRLTGLPLDRKISRLTMQKISAGDR